MASHMNVYSPFERKDPTHEDNLTRAFLIVLKCVPAAHAAFLQLVDQGHRRNRGDGISALHELPEFSVETQISCVSAFVDRVMSVLLTDEHYFMKDDVGPSERKQVLDGLVTYSSTLALAIENKPFVGNVWEDQLSVNVAEETEHDKRVACVEWRKIVSACDTLLQNGLLGTAENVLVDDFLTFVEEYFPKLQPFSNLKVCGNDPFRITRRCRMLLEEIAPESVKSISGRGWYINIEAPAVAIRIALVAVPSEDVNSISLQVWPGDTLGQARELYRDFEYAVIEDLEKDGWEAEPNFHLSFMQQHLVYPTTKLNVRDYWNYWKSEAEQLRQQGREEWGSFFRSLIENGNASIEDEAGFHEKFTDTQRTTMNVCPGLFLRYEIPLDEAVKMDIEGELCQFVKTKISKMAEGLKITLPQIQASA